MRQAPGMTDNRATTGPAATGSGMTREQVQDVVRTATRAPSVHNTQPWRFTTRADGVDLHADTGRLLEVLDPDGRQLHLSCGAALLHARVAARAQGLDVRVELFPDDDAGHLAAVHLAPGDPATDSEALLADAIERRHTHRERFEDRLLEDGLVDELRRSAEAEGAMLRPVRGEDDLIALEVLLSRADQYERNDPEHQAELARWVTPEARSDGIPQSVLPTDPQRGSSLRLRNFSPDEPVNDGGAAPPAEHPDVLVVASRDDSPESWLRAGMALDAVLLRAAAAGVLAQPLGQVTDVPAFRQRLAAALSMVGVPQIVLRVGYAASTGGTSRRGLEDVLDAAGREADGDG